MYDLAADLCYILSKRHKDYLAERKKQTLEQVCKQVRQAVFSLHSKEETVTIRKVGDYLEKPAYIRVTQVIEAFHEAMREAGLEQ